MPLKYSPSCRSQKASVRPMLLGAIVSAVVGAGEVSTPQSTSQGAATESIEQLDEVVVTGRLPGPPLWKISHNGNVLWILPLIDAYPSKMEWDSSRVEALIAQSQEYIERPIAYRGVAATNPLTMIQILRLSKRTRTLPEGQRLQDALPPDLYRRFSSLKARYLPRDKEVERVGISAAGSRLQKEALDQENLETLQHHRSDSPRVITSKLSKWIKRNKTMRRTSTSHGTTHKLSSGDLKLAEKAMEEAGTTSAFAKWEVTCLDKAVTYFEKDIDLVKRRANAWARGHADGLIDPSPLRGRGDACNDPPALPEDSPAMMSLRKEAPGLAAMLLNDRSEAQLISRDRWAAAAEAAMASNRSTFSTLYIGDIVAEDGLIARLAAKGYDVAVSAE